MLDEIAERKIAEAIARGELDDLPGAGRPLALDDDAHVGYVPPEVQTLNRIAQLERLVDDAPVDERLRVLKKIALLRTAAEARPGRRPARTWRRRV